MAVALQVVRAVEWVCECEDPRIEVRYRVYANGVKHFHRQCLSCGDWSGSIAQKDLSVIQRAKALLADEAIRERKHEERRRQWEEDAKRRAEDWSIQRREWEQELADKDAEWWGRYEEYLRSEGWRRRRDAVLKRDGYKCQSCLFHQATEVHHLTYKHVFKEPLFDLVSICTRCHNLITEMEREWRQKIGMRR